MPTKTDIAELLELADWLSVQPCRCASSGEIAQALPHLRHWVSVAWASKRLTTKVIYYRSGYGWQLFRNYKSRLKKLTDEINERAIFICEL